MGKGGGCFPSKSKTKKPDDAVPPAEPPAPEPAAAAAATSAEPAAPPAATAAEPAASTAEAAGAATTEAPKTEAEAPPESTTPAAKPAEPAAVEGSAPAAPVAAEAAPVEAAPAAAEPVGAEAAPADAAAAAAATEAAAPSSETPATGSGDVPSAVAAVETSVPEETPAPESGPSAGPDAEPVPEAAAAPAAEPAEPIPEPPSVPEAVAEAPVPEAAVVVDAAVAPAAVETVEAGAKGEEKAAEGQETAPAEVVPPSSNTVKVYIVFYSMYGHVLTMAHKVKEGVDSVDGAQGFLFQVPETLPDAVLAKMGAPSKPLDIPEITPKALFEADAIIFGFPTRFGMMCAQMKQFLDATGSLWRSQALSGKPAGFFFSTGTQGGGQETTAGYTYQGLFNPEVHGGSPYGAGTYVADGSRNPSELELEMAAHQGRLTAIVGAKLKKGSLAEEAEEGN
ncbi:unnamed protein product [Closterium sp. NIES-53]